MTAQVTANILDQHQSALVLGLGVTGYSAVRYLHKQGVDITVMDTRAEPPQKADLEQRFPQARTFFGGIDHDLLAKHSLVVISPGLDLKAPELAAARKHGAEFVGDIELFLQVNQKPVIAITGSNGKSTVTALVGRMCEHAGLSTLVAGNIGYPALDALTDNVPYDVAVLELSSFQLETITRVSAISATILNISPDHMDRYASMGDYVLAKARILRGAKQVVLPRHQDSLAQITKVADTVTFGTDAPRTEKDFGVEKIKQSQWLVHGKQRLVKQKNIPLLGRHNIENVLAAFALVNELGLDKKKITAVAKSFTGLPHRMEIVASADGVTWVNDSKATNVGATVTALKSLDQDVILIAGGQGKSADFSALQDAISPTLKQVVLVGQDAQLIADALSGLVPILRADDMAAAVAKAGKRASQNTVVLLSPACASFDMYENFEQRGDHFCELVQAWISQNKREGQR